MVPGGWETVTDERTLREAIRSLADRHDEWVEEGRAYEFSGCATARCYGETDAITLRWILRGVTAALEFRLVVEDLASRRPRAHVVEQVVVLHSPSPLWMLDHYCGVLKGRYCLCVASPKAGHEMASWFFEKINAVPGPEASVWKPLLELYCAATEPGYHPDVAGVDRGSTLPSEEGGRKGGCVRDTPLIRLLELAQADR
jgi:hypothetical protein